MTQQYVQTVDVEVPGKARSMQWAGISLILAALGFIVISAFYSWYFMFAFAALFAVGGILLHLYNKTAKEYTYEFSQSRLRIISKDVVNRQRIYLDLLWKDVLDFEIMSDAYDEKSDLLCTSKAYEQGVWQMTFTLGNEKKRLLFVPDDYMIALINEIQAKQIG